MTLRLRLIRNVRRIRSCCGWTRSKHAIVIGRFGVLSIPPLKGKIEYIICVLLHLVAEPLLLLVSLSDDLHASIR